MKRRATSRRPETNAAVNATPLIDVVLCMIIFFLIVGQLAEGQRLPMDLPEAEMGEEDRPRDSVVINLLREGDAEQPTIMVSGDSLDLEGVERLLRERSAENAGITVEVRAPGDAPYRWVEDTMDACARAGIADVRLAAARPRSGS
ncbi:MAG: ExbD/TolR family protein [Phycisphaerales bacterium]